MLISESFGPTIQGEGPSAGQRALFIRLSRCNLTCRACDTPYTWDWTRFDSRRESRRVSINELVDWAAADPARLVVITGGEPLIQQDALGELVAGLATAGKSVEVETNGTIAPATRLSGLVRAFNVSPKLSSFGAGMPSSRRIRENALKEFMSSGKAVFKFVVAEPADLEEVAVLEQRLGLTPIWIMPEGVTQEVILERLRGMSDEVIMRGWNISTRMHVLLWGDQRGR